MYKIYSFILTLTWNEIDTVFSNLGSYLKGHTFSNKTFLCEEGAGFSLQWKEPYRDKDLVIGYEVYWREETIRYNRRSGSEFVGMNTTYDTACSLKLQPGRLYLTTVRTHAELKNPKENITVPESSGSIILGKLKTT